MAVPLRRQKIVLLQMPFANTGWPSLGLSTLKSLLNERGHETSILYVNQSFSDKIGEGRYSSLADGAPQNVDLAGEWVFSGALWGQDLEADDAYFESVLEGRDPAHAKSATPDTLKDVRTRLSEVASVTASFLQEWATPSIGDVSTSSVLRPPSSSTYRRSPSPSS